MKSLGVVLVLSLAVVSPQRLGVRLSPTGGGGGGSIITQSDFTLLGYSTIPGWEASHPSNPGATPITGTGAVPTTCGLVSGIVHCFTPQTGDGTYFGPFSVYEYVDPGTYGSTPGTATAWTYYRNWGFSNGVPYDMYHNVYGKTYNPSGTLIDLGGLQYSNNVTGISYHEVAGVRYIYTSYGLPYGAPVPPTPWNLVVTRLDNPGTADANQTGLATTATGPYRICAGMATPPGINHNEVCGPTRASLMEDLPDNTMGVSSTPGFIHFQNAVNQGPSLWGGTAWPTISTPAGFGSTRDGNVDLRTTDIQMVTDYLSHYALNESNIQADGTLNPGQVNWTGHRPSYPTPSLPPNPPGFANYQYNGGTGSRYGVALNATSPVVDPLKYGGIGSWVNGDNSTQMNWVQGTKTGVLTAGAFAVGPYWYKTRTTQLFSPYGTDSNVLFMRGPQEAWSATCFRQSNHAGDCTASPVANADVRFDVTPANYSSVPANVVTVKYQKDGANSSLSCTASGKAVTVHLATNGSNVSTSSANSVISIVNTTGACSALVTASISAEMDGGGYTNNGTGVIPGVIDYDYAAAQTAGPSGALQLAYGPAYSPIDGIDLGIDVTGPNAIYHPAVIVYDPSTFQQTPDYNVTPTSFIWLKLIDSNFPCATLGSFNYPQCGIGGSFFDPTTRKYYVVTNQVDFTQPLNPKPIIAVFQIAGSPMPEPTFLDWLWSLAPSWLKHPIAKPVSLLEPPQWLK